MIKTGNVFLLFVILATPLGALASDGSPVLPDVWTARNSVQFCLENSPDSAQAGANKSTSAATMVRAVALRRMKVSPQWGQKARSVEPSRARSEQQPAIGCPFAQGPLGLRDGLTAAAEWARVPAGYTSGIIP